ncbi:hypothetical protein L6452_42689 [Arctium lappa]|uniref:Uncharacterized protein n=1 Tax=Arctium lappa TaxID=4217 RepID=A0ACB8XJQ9_ARCLA|nr:hypothetical protein L6452_42689 [Arctium lappa]
MRSHQKAMRDFIRDNNLHICATLESCVLVSNLPRICDTIFGPWSWVSNGSLSPRVTRIIVAWDPNHVDMMLIDATDQVMHFSVEIRGTFEKLNSHDCAEIIGMYSKPSN